jgi:hypothetical protein
MFWIEGACASDFGNSLDNSPVAVTRACWQNRRRIELPVQGFQKRWHHIDGKVKDIWRNLVAGSRI